MLSFALKTLFFDRAKLLIALLGVTFSLVLVNVQGGLFLGLIGKASVIIDNCEADIWVGHRGVENSDFAAEIPEAWLNRVRGLPGISRAEPYIVAASTLNSPTGDTETVFVLGSDRASMLGGGWSFSQGSRQDLQQPNSISVDEFDVSRFGTPKLGDVMEINGNRAKVVAMTNGILGFSIAPYVFTTLESARKYSGIRDGYCSFFLVKANEDTDLSELCARIHQRVPQLDAFTAKDFSFKARMYWTIQTGIGLSFGASTLLGLVVGLVMVAQSLYAFVLDHLSDYATLKAIGAEDKHVQSVLITQGMAIAIIGITLGTATSFLIQRLVSTPITPIVIPRWLLLAGICLVTVICFISSILPFGRIARIDPVMALQD